MKWVEGKIIALKEWTTGLYSLFMEAPIMPFAAGQFTRLCLGDPALRFYRPYSFVNAPHDPTLEFYFTMINTGEFTKQLAKRSPNDEIYITEKASGRFILKEVPSAHTLWLFGTGTGIGPFLCFLKTQEPWERFAQIVLVHSVRYANDLTHQSLIIAWQNAYSSKFHWIPIITREKIPNVLTEHCTALLKSGRLESLVGLPLSAMTSQVMLCGNPSMVNDMTATLLTRNLKINRSQQLGHITVENYWKA